MLFKVSYSKKFLSKLFSCFDCSFVSTLDNKTVDPTIQETEGIVDKEGSLASTSYMVTSFSGNAPPLKF